VRVVLDTNVLVAAHATVGLCHEVLVSVTKHHELVFFTGMLTELERVLREKVKMTPANAREVVDLLSVDSIPVEPEVLPPSVCRDPDDCVVLGTALAGRADLIVSGDEDLLTIGSFRGIPIISPRGCFERLRPSRGGAGQVAERRRTWGSGVRRNPNARVRERRRRAKRRG